jgi:hypothetical protein
MSKMLVPESATKEKLLATNLVVCQAWIVTPWGLHDPIWLNDDPVFVRIVPGGAVFVEYEHGMEFAYRVKTRIA